MIKISKETAINPKQVMCICRTKELQTVVFVIGFPKAFVSDYTFDETVDMLTIKNG